MKRAVILLSGGMDSATCLAIARGQSFEAHTLAVNYGQRHLVELDAAARVSKSLRAASHRVVSVDLRSFGGSALTDDLTVPTDRSTAQMDKCIPITYVPARNTVFLSMALALAEVCHAFDIFIGANAVDYSGYPDCRPEFLAQFEVLANLATKAGVEGEGRFTIHAPLLKMTKAQIIAEGTRLGVDFSETISCYQADAQGRACGRCDSCLLRKKGFAEANIADPTRYYGSTTI